MRRLPCCSLLVVLVTLGCGDDGSPAEGTTGSATTSTSSSSSSSSTGDDTSSSSGSGEDSTTMAAEEDTGTPINCGPQVCAPDLVCVREETVMGSTSTGEPGTGTTGTGTGTGTTGGGMGGGGEMMVEWFCRARPEECTATADCACAAVLCPAASCECVDEADNSIGCVPGPSC